MAGLGAFLLVAAAATFVAVRWDDIPAGAKLAALVAVTLACLQAHLRLRPSLPATATVLLHLGVLLVPIDVAALGVRFGWDWPTMLLAQGITATLVFGVAARAERSVVLQAATWLGVVVLAGGIGGLTVAPAGLVLAGGALATVAARRPAAWFAAGRAAATEGVGGPAGSRRRAGFGGGAEDLWAGGWAVLAGLAMPLAAGESLGVPGAGVLADLGLTGDDSAVGAGITGLVAGLVLGIVGGRRRSLPAALAGIGCVLAGATTAGLNLAPDSTRPEQLDVATGLMAVATLGLLAELAAGAWRADAFWHRPTGILATLAELVAGTVTLAYVSVGLSQPLDVERSPEAALAAALIALTWLAATTRHAEAPRGDAAATGSTPPAGRMSPDGGRAASPPTTRARGPAGDEGQGPAAGRVAGWSGAGTATPHPVVAVGPVAAAVAACAAVALATGSGSGTAWALTVFGGAVVVAAPRLPRDAGTGIALAVGLLAAAPAIADQATDDPTGGGRLLLVAGLGLAGAVITAVGAVTTTAVRPAREVSSLPSLLAVLTLVPLAVTAATVDASGESAAAVTLALAGIWLVAAILDLADLPTLAAPVGRPHPAAATASLRSQQQPGYPAGALGEPGRRPVTGPGGAGIGSDLAALLPAVELTTVIRAAGLVPLVLALALPAGQAAAVAGLAAALALLDALRRDRPGLLVGTGVAVPIAVGGLALDQGLDLADAGLLVTLSGVGWLSLAGSLPRRWAVPALIAAGVAGGAGFALCSDDRAALASYLLITGTALAAVGVAVVHRPLVGIGAALTTVGFWSHLSLAEVTASEPYVAPAALLAVAAGIAARHRPAASSGLTGHPGERGPAGPAGPLGPVSSWIAYTPSVALLGGAALAERLAGGPAWHALVAGAVGIVAVGAGGLGRTAGPLLAGTVLVVAVTVHETLGVTAQLPTWVWLASGGTLLLAAGIAMERRDTGPVETGKRLVDLVREQFT